MMDSAIIEVWDDDDTGELITLGRNEEGALCADCSRCAYCGRSVVYQCAGFRRKEVTK